MTDNEPLLVSGKITDGDAISRASGVQRNLFSAEMRGWGCYPVKVGQELRSEDLEWSSRYAVLSRGLGRSYGDAALPASEEDILNVTTLADRFLGFDEKSGVVRAEAGLSLQRLNEWSLPRGRFVPVTPGTQYVTLGGMVAADVHGKNHHVNGCIGEHVTALKMMLADGRVLEVSERDEPELFRATIGGMGLTGHILEVALQLERIRSTWIWQESEQVSDLDTLVERLQEAGKNWPFTVAWADALNGGRALGRGILIKGRWAEPEEARREFRYASRTVSLPVTLPDWFLSPPAVQGFNRFHYIWHRSRLRRELAHPAVFFYPLDALIDWNRLYGKRGFIQYQCVVPVSGSLAPHRRLLETIADSGGAYLCVIKDCGGEGKGSLSFPKPGISFALDIPVRPGLRELVDRLNELVADQGGRIYLAKDALTRPEHFRAMEPRLEEWMAVRRKWDPEGKLRSALSQRLLGEES